jgi:hypothetical protein
MRFHFGKVADRSVASFEGLTSPPQHAIKARFVPWPVRDRSYLLSQGWTWRKT